MQRGAGGLSSYNRKEFTDTTISGFAYGIVVMIFAAVLIWLLDVIVD